MTEPTTTRCSSYGQRQLSAALDAEGHILLIGAQQLSEPAPIPSRLAALIDHTLLKPEATELQVRQLCAEAAQYHFGAVCVNSAWVPLCARELAGSDVKIAAVVGFPLGAMSTAAKVAETQDATQQGAREIDMVMAIGALKSGQLSEVAADIREVAHAAHQGDALLKVIIEACLLSEEEKIDACLLSKLAGADFVKTSTGFSSSGATVEDVALMRAVVGPNLGVKAAGGIRSYADAKKMLAAGASRIGASAGIRILQEEAAAQS